MDVGVRHPEIMSDRILVGLFHFTSRKSGEMWQFHGCQVGNLNRGLGMLDMLI